MEKLKSILEYFIENQIFTISGENGEYVNITFMAKEALAEVKK